MRAIRLLSVTAGCVALAISTSSCASGTPAKLAEVVLDEQLDKIPSEYVVCVSVDGKDADPALLATLRNRERTVVPASECEWNLDTTRGSEHRVSGRKAMLVDVAANRALDEVRYESRHHGKSATILLLKVRNNQGTWQVVDVVKIEAA